VRIHRVTNQEFKKEYGILCQRVYSDQTGDTPFGATWCLVDPLKRTAPHQHEDGETFFIIDGHGLMTIGDEREEVRAGDVVFIPPHSEHCLINVSNTKQLKFISVYWIDAPAEVQPHVQKEEGVALSV